MSIGGLWSNLAHSERNCILIEKVGFCLSWFRNLSMYTLILIVTSCLGKIIVTKHVCHLCPPSLSSCHTGALCITESVAWSWKTLERKVGQNLVSEPDVFWCRLKSAMVKMLLFWLSLVIFVVSNQAVVVNCLHWNSRLQVASVLAWMMGFEPLIGPTSATCVCPLTGVAGIVGFH